MLDADILIAGERGDFNLSAWMNSIEDDEAELAAITVAELRHGLERATAAHRHRRQTYLDAILDACAVIPYTLNIAFIHARIWAELEAEGAMIGAHDLIVAATALERGAAVATFNARHFAAVPGLRVITPF